MLRNYQFMIQLTAAGENGNSWPGKYYLSHEKVALREFQKSLAVETMLIPTSIPKSLSIITVYHSSIRS